MPAIARGSSARSRRRNPSPTQDDIEEADATQRSRADDVEEDAEEDEQRPRRGARAKSVKSERASTVNGASGSRKRKSDGARTSQERGANQNVDVGQDEDEDDIINVEDFGDHPLLRSDMSKISGMATSEWSQLERNVMNSMKKLVKEIGVVFADASVMRGDIAEEAKREMEAADGMMREIIDLEAELKAHQTTLVSIANDVARQEEIRNALARYEGGVEDAVEAWQGKTSRQKYGKHEDYAKFRGDLWEVLHDNQGMPPLIELIPREEGDDDDDDDDDIVIGGVTQNYKCPLTMAILEKPMTSKTCHHTFSRASIQEYLGTSRPSRKKCPAAGCNAMIAITDFQLDEEMERKVQAYVRRENRRRADEEEEMVGDLELVE